MKDPAFISRHGLSVNVPVAGCTTIKSGGNADFYGEVSDPTAFQQLLQAAARNGINVTVIGQGSRTVVSDHGVRGLVIKNRISFVDIGAGVASCGTGVAISEVIQTLAAAGYGGFEQLVSEPGSLGGLLKSRPPRLEPLIDRLENVSLVDKGSVQELKRDAFVTMDGDYTVLACTFRVEEKNREALNHAMLTATQAKLRGRPGRVPHVAVFADAEASDCVRQLGMAGERVGGAVISAKDPNYISNDQGATSHDVYELAQRMKNRVKVKLGRTLTEAIYWVGEW